jgi:hypothetical protein
MYRLPFLFTGSESFGRATAAIIFGKGNLCNDNPFFRAGKEKSGFPGYVVFRCGSPAQAKAAFGFISRLPRTTNIGNVQKMLRKFEKSRIQPGFGGRPYSG